MIQLLCPEYTCLVLIVVFYCNFAYWWLFAAAEMREMDFSIPEFCFSCCEFLEIKLCVSPQSLFLAPDLVLVIQNFDFHP